MYEKLDNIQKQGKGIGYIYSKFSAQAKLN